MKCRWPRSERRRTQVSAPFASLLALLGLAAVSPASAQTSPGVSAAAPAVAGQQALAVRVGPQGITANVCPGAACAPDGGAALEVPADVKPLLARARAAAVVLADGKHLVRVDVPGAREAERWVMLIAAPPAAANVSAPVVLWSGWTGVAKGEHGEGRSMAVLEERQGKGSRIVIGEQREDVTICGRPTLVSPREVDPVSVTLTKRAAVQNITPEERAKATKITAARVPEGRPASPVRLLRATAASSAVEKKFATLTDGDPATTWSEAKAGDGRGEFVSMSSASEVGITGIDIALRPEAEEGETAAPRTLFLATPDRLFEVAIPEDARKAGGLYEVKLPQAVQTSCLTVVLEDAHVPRGAKNPRVTIAEVAARTALGDLSLEALVGALAGGGERARASKALLERGGAAATKATIEGYTKLDEDGKRLALGVIEAAPCAEQVPFFTERMRAPQGSKTLEKKARVLAGEGDSEMDHARDRIRRCGRAAAPALVELVASAPEKTKLIAASELALVAPAEAVPVLIEVLPKTGDAARRELRAALAHAAKSERARGALATLVEPERFKALPEVAQVDLLRAIGPRLGAIEGSAQAFGSLAAPGASFRTRYLLQAPAAELARSGDARALAFLRQSLRSDAEPHIRARAAEVTARVPALVPDLVAAVEDQDVRVRESAVLALASATAAGVPPTPTMSSALARRLTSDPWTFVRSGAASALGAMPAGQAADSALAAALADASPDVRGRALDALGAHRAVAYIEPVRERSEDIEEHLEVRARAILALAAMCDARSLDTWTKLAGRAARPLDDRDRRLGSAAIAALGVVHPSDLQARLAPLLRKDVPPAVREVAKAALSSAGACRR